ncbi:hypothetical protein [Selenomonas ruminantium]|uniref:Uncharacterized protein n=1 Tax=Selenomonas ruminantium TaxID=971 RepID=A0A1I0V355_SELRU|nr:hypothetical protein [Selenomonas ruminantium]SFA70682.1 hypothetical protein SAMN05216587_101208 [Selenomonas ruminantium]
MKKSILALFAVIMVFSSFAEARIIMYANGDYNYPIWASGNRGGSTLDLRTAMIMPDTGNGQYLETCANNYFLWYDKGDGKTYENGTLQKDKYIYFREYNDGSGLYYVVAEVPWDALPWKKINPDDYFDYGINDAYYLLKCRVEKKQ